MARLPDLPLLSPGFLLKPFRDSFRLSGRSIRLEVVAYFIVTGAVAALFFYTPLGDRTAFHANWLPGPSHTLTVGDAVALFYWIPLFGLLSRRMHDQGRPGWLGVLLVALSTVVDLTKAYVADPPPFQPLQLLGFVIAMLVLTVMFWNPTPGPNRYGPDPRSDEPDERGHALA